MEWQEREVRERGEERGGAGRKEEGQEREGRERREERGGTGGRREEGQGGERSTTGDTYIMCIHKTHLLLVT